MAITRRAFVSLPANAWLSDADNEMKWAIIERIESLGLSTEIISHPRSALSGRLAWTPAVAEDIMRRCCGAVLLGFSRWSFSTASGVVNLPTDYCHYEGALAYSMRLPLLTIVQTDVERRIVFGDSFAGLVPRIPIGATPAWLDTGDFTEHFDVWVTQLKERSDVFLGYCSAAASTAKAIKRRLAGDGATVLDWQTDLAPGQSILGQIEQAAARCGAGIFLFTKDDEVTATTDEAKAVPRDNVVFEAGYFIQAKGKDRVLIVREKGAKMPADLGGDIYAELEDRNKVAPIAETLRRFVAGL